MNTPEANVLAAILLCLGGALVTLLTARWRRATGWICFAVTGASAFLVGFAVVHVLSEGAGEGATFMPIPQLGFALRLYVDGLTTVFLALAALVAVPAALYSIPYLDHYPDYSVRRYYPHFLVFLSAMYGLVSTTDMMWFFFIFWQLMTLPGYALIRFENRRPANIRAANKYLLMMQVACAATMVGAALLAGSTTPAMAGASHYDFDTVSLNLPLLLETKPVLVTSAFALFLLGFGIKMGMWPFGVVWLPDAHPAAPSPVSAMLSGVMIKTGVYGLIRYFLWLVPADHRAQFPLSEWGLIISVLGTLTLFLGTLQAIRQEQTKRLLAFHSIGQVGYILFGVGAALALLGSGPAAEPLAAIALFGALFHTINHGAFKALLFLNAGSLLYRAGTQDLTRLGGMFRLMPLTGATALIASLAIAGVPPLNGFASKWSLYVAGIQGSPFVALLPVCAVIAILTSALTLASFIKFFGAAFLSRPGTHTPTSRQEVGLAMLLPQFLLATVCVVLGLFPGVAYRAMEAVLNTSQQGLGVTLAASLPQQHSALGGLAALDNQALILPAALLALLALAFLAAVALSRLGNATRRRAPRWLCGYATDTPATHYTAHHFYGELKAMDANATGTPTPTDSRPGSNPAHPSKPAGLKPANP